MRPSSSGPDGENTDRIESNGAPHNDNANNHASNCAATRPAVIFAQAAVGLAEIAADGQFALVNDELCALLGRDRTKILASGIAGYAGADDGSAARHALDRVMNSADRVSFEQRHERGDGETVWLNWTLTRLQDLRANGSPVIASVIDITRRKKIEEALTEASRQKDRFLATLAHELRNPLAPLSYAVELLREDGRHDADWSRGVIERQIRQLTRLIDDLLDLSRITRDQLEVRRELIATGDIVQAAIEASRSTLKHYHQELEVGLPSEPVHVLGDRVRLTQALTNLLTNAAKFTTGPGRVWLTVERLGDQVVLCIRDSGIGIAPDELPHLFEMFYQGRRAPGRAHGGLGIGLYLVRRLVALHGGTVEAISDGENQGSELIVTLPVATGVPAVRSVDIPDELRRRRPHGRRVLVVDDNRDSADALAKLLRGNGNEVETAYDGAAAVEAAKRFRPDAVLLDLGMPKLNGYEVCRLIREQPWGATVQLIALTGWGRAEDRMRTKSAGFDNHLVKPVSLTAVESLLERRRARA